ncbi:phosphopantetheine-binding protein [Mesomycoplasma neurolyticum]|uniref:Acyl carrier protein n=1 Tax=Mesomycoplasma neurolyticum TaxID=2120 RepID=A0A449A6C7_9BACT|nr:phosphopantetheine-binding protein [Mesomycoplasma neurolyticum]VEU59811.1 acyl carrier protein [Mesomycoplasma neurolyticum]
MKKMVFSKIKKLTNKKFDENSLISSLGVDSLDLIELVTEIESELKIEISDEELIQIKTVLDVINLLEIKRKNN